MWEKRIDSFRFAWNGIVDLIKTQTNARTHLLMAIIAISLGLFVGLNFTEWAIITLCITGVLAAEAFNTSLEYLTNLVSPEYHPLAGKAKDAAAGGVLLVAIGAAIVGVFIFIPKIVALVF